MEQAARFINETDFAAHRIVRTNGEITIDGLYPEKQAGRHMVRIRITGGRITLDQGYALADLAEQHADHEWHVDTRQNIELHGVKAENIIPLLEAIEAKAGLTTRGSCGDTVRNVIVGAEADRFSPNGKDRPLQAMADAITKYFAGNPEFETLPRKFKIAIYGLEDREPLHRLHDVGFLEETRSDVSLPLTFSTWIGGGLGKAPRLGDLFFRGVPANEAVKLVEAVVRVFHDYGNRKNRAQARFKWVLKELGADKVRELILQRWTPPEGVDIEPVLSEDRQGLSPFSPGGIHLQADGRYRVYVPLIAGDIDTTTARRVLDIARKHGARELQLGTRQNIAIPDVEPGKENELAKALADIGYAPEGWGGPRDVVACPGADQCRKAFVETRNFAKDYAKALDAVDAPAWAKRIRIGMSGCPNSCTMPHINGLGFRGSVGRVDGKTRQGFDVLLGGRLVGGTRLGVEIANHVSHEESVALTAAAIRLFSALGVVGESFDAMLDRIGVAVFARRLREAVTLEYGIWMSEMLDPVSIDGAPMSKQDFKVTALELSAEKPRAILQWAITTYGESLLVTTALNAGGVLLLRYLKELGDVRPAYFIDTGKHFPETLQYRDLLVNRYGFNIATVNAGVDERAFEKEFGPELHKRDPDLCCAIRKVQPARALLAGKRAWLTALRREQGGARSNVDVLELDEQGVARVNPFAHVSREEIDRELELYGIPQHPLHAQGYVSIGCQPCTTKGRGGNERAGRWPGLAKSECGLHGHLKNNKT